MHYRYFRPGVKNKFTIVASILRLSTKYLAPALRQQAIEMFMTAYPSTYDAWKQRGTARLVAPIDNEFGLLVVLAEQTDVRVVLPGLFYAAAKRPLAETLAQLHALPLSEAVKQDVATKFLLGREALQKEEITEVLAFFQAGFVRPNCQNNNDGNILLNFTRTVLYRMPLDEPYHEYCVKNPDAVGPNIGVCANCTNTIRDHIESANRKIWQRLPEFFGLPAWEVLTANEDGH